MYVTDLREAGEQSIMISKNLRPAGLLALAAACALSLACAKTAHVKVPSTTFDMARAELRDAVAEFASSAPVRPRIRTITFTYDSYTLDDTARAILKTNAEVLRADEDIRVLIEGHCDERGTLEYNLALGERRAGSVREFYEQLGVPLERIKTISYGKEQPLCLGDGEDCHNLNRRARTVAD